MNILFHYYAVRWLAREVGIPDADGDCMARSSQFVDEAVSPLRLESGRAPYDLAVTQDYLFWDDSILSEVYLPFHFLPGDGDEAARRRRDGAVNPWAVTPNGEPAREVLVEALKTRNPYRIGIALHTFADGWAHQNFTAKWEDYNAMDGAAALPPVGHLQALTRPDEPSRLWTDPRLFPELFRIDNVTRYIEAARKIFRYLRTYLRRPFVDEELLLPKLEALLRAQGGRDGVEAAFIVDGDIPRYEKQEWRRAAGVLDGSERADASRGYDKLLWLKSQAERRMGYGVRTVRAGEGFFDSDLYRWNEAAREHRRAAKTALAQI